MSSTSYADYSSNDSTSYDDYSSSGDEVSSYSSDDGSSDSSSSVPEGLNNYKLAREQLCPNCIMYILGHPSNVKAHIFSFLVASGMMMLSQRLACWLATGITSRDGELRWFEDVAWDALRQKAQDTIHNWQKKKDTLSFALWSRRLTIWICTDVGTQDCKGLLKCFLKNGLLCLIATQLNLATFHELLDSYNFIQMFSTTRQRRRWRCLGFAGDCWHWQGSTSDMTQQFATLWSLVSGESGGFHWQGFSSTEIPLAEHCTQNAACPPVFS